MNISETIAALLVIILAVAAIIFFPILYIWCLNSLVPTLAIPYTLKTWFAMVIIKLFMLGGIASVTLRNQISKIGK